MSAKGLVNIHDAKTHFSRLVAQAERGQEITIGRAGKPVAKIVPYEPVGGKRRLGLLAGKVTIPDDFDTPLPDEVLASFEAP